MKSTCVIYALLGVTMSLFVLVNGANLTEIKTPNATISQTLSTTAEPPKNTTVSITSASISAANTSAFTSVPTTSVSTISVPTTPASTIPASTVPTSTTLASTTSPITPTPTKSTEKTTSETPPVTSTNASTLITTTTQSQTTAIPSPSSSSKDRHFDGLSFFGGIILTTCLMAIAVFSWKFYRQCNEGNYRTL